jgi:hypothetical protein
MIPDLLAQLRNSGVAPVFTGIVLAVVFTAALVLAQSVAQWFADRDS